MNKLQKEWKYIKRDRELILLSLPAVIYKLIFSYIPLVFLLLAFKRFRFDLGLWGSEWVGWANFRFFFESDIAWLVTRNTVLYNVTFIAVTTIIALAVAIMLNELCRRLQKVYQTVLFLPYFLSWVVVGYIVIGFMDHQNGFVNQILLSWDLEPVKWYQQSAYWPWILTLSHVWKAIGFTTLIYFAGIIGIDPSYYEAAKIDGASRWQMVRKITIPLIMPLMIILLIMEMGKIFRADFGLFYFIPNDTSFLYSATDVIDTYVYRSLRVVGDLGMSTAVGLYQSVVGLILVVTTNAIIKKSNSDNALW